MPSISKSKNIDKLEIRVHLFSVRETPASLWHVFIFYVLHNYSNERYL